MLFLIREHEYWIITFVQSHTFIEIQSCPLWGPRMRSLPGNTIFYMLHQIPLQLLFNNHPDVSIAVISALVGNSYELLITLRISNFTYADRDDGPATGSRPWVSATGIPIPSGPISWNLCGVFENLPQVCKCVRISCEQNWSRATSEDALGARIQVGGKTIDNIATIIEDIPYWKCILVSKSQTKWEGKR